LDLFVGVDVVDGVVGFGFGECGGWGEFFYGVLWVGG